jgi:hypothetical protein
MLGRLRSRRPAHGPLAFELAKIPREVATDYRLYSGGFARDTPTGAALLERPPDELAKVALGALEIAASTSYEQYGQSRSWELHQTCDDVAAAALRRALPFTDAELARLLALPVAIVKQRKPYRLLSEGVVKGVLGAVERRAGDEPAPEELRKPLRRLAGAIPDETADDRKLRARIARLLGEDEPALSGGEPWADAMLAARKALPPADREAADRVLALAATATAAKPSKAFRTGCDELLEDHGRERIGTAAARLLEAAVAVRGSDRNGIPSPELGDVLRGLAFILAAAGGEDAARVLADLAVAGWRKVPGWGPLSSKAANAAINGLADLPDGAAQLGRIRGQLKRPTAVAAVDKAIDRAAERLAIPRAEFEERVVPDFGLDASGTRTVELGEHTAMLDGTGALTFANAASRTLKSVPAAVKREHPEAVAELKRTAKEIKAMAAGQRLRLERLLREDRSWTGAGFRERYADHGLVGPLARRLIWTVDGESVLGDDAPADDATVRLWHPVDAAPEDVHRWRRELEAAELTQPFKQAHREVYLLTEAERTTGAYSNRFAAHVLRQHQMAALAETRGWRYRLQGGFDGGDGVAELELPEHGLRAEFWIDVPHDDGDLSESGIYNHVLSDQVRFTDLDRAVVRLEEVPVRVFSEVMRDVDLFVGVTSIGNDPTWGDAGDRAYREYWTGYAFGELGEHARMRREVLERLLPKLALADVAEVDGRYLRVRGRLGTYRIHLGSSNILMEPNDRYLCIVSGRDPEARSAFYLPFEGDHMLALILSKAFLLARDDEIEDPTITAQIGAR